MALRCLRSKSGIMKIKIKDYIKIEKKPKKGLMALEWVMLGYLLITLLIVFFCYTKVQNPQAMIWLRVNVAVTTLLVWGVYRMVPCRLTFILRPLIQLAMLSYWYSDTYEINRMLPNLDHVFAGFEQQVFGCQPALLFSKVCSSAVFSELMDMGYVAYFPMIVTVVLYYAVRHYQLFEYCSFTILTSFFLFYLIFISLPVTGPMFYYQAVGLDDIARGVFPNVHDYFYTHQECLPSPGYTDGFFYNLVVSAHEAGERPTAAFPSSHVGITTVLMWLVWQVKGRKLFWILTPFYILLFLSTVYIQAHYAIDAIAGLITGTIFFWGLYFLSGKMRRGGSNK